MDLVKQQYETFPYPERDPADEATRLIEGSPSHPVEIDHYLFRGQRDWGKPFRALVAGGGTGDGLIMLAQKLADIGCPAEITYIDMSEASRAIAEARAAARGLDITFVTGDLLSAPDLGPFDYIDCCGVLHHLPDPDAGFRAMAEALAPEGGMGLMVYAPYGRSGVYPLQHAFRMLFGNETPEQQVFLVDHLDDGIPEQHPFKLNAVLGDHRTSRAGIYDLLLHARDRPYTVIELAEALERAGLGLVSLVGRARYDPVAYSSGLVDLGQYVKPLAPIQRLAVGEQLNGTIKTHVAYVTLAGREDKAEARPTKPDMVPHLLGVSAKALAHQVHQKGGFSVTEDGVSLPVTIPKTAAPLIARIDGRVSLHQIAGGQDWMSFAAAWGPVHHALTGINVLHYSKDASR